LRPPLQLVYRGEIYIYQNPFALPRAFFVRQAQVVAGADEALERVLSLGRQLDRVAVLEEPPPRAGSAASAGEAHVKVLKYTPRRVSVGLRTPSSGYLVLGDTYYPGWKAYVDGAEAPIYRADYLLRAVPVGPGEHHVVFSYRPWTAMAGLWTSLIALCIVRALNILRSMVARERGVELGKSAVSRLLGRLGLSPQRQFGAEGKNAKHD
jgi:hypothetical protein